MPDMNLKDAPRIFGKEVREAMANPGPHSGQARAFLEPNDGSGETSDGGFNPAVKRLREAAARVELNEHPGMPDVSNFRFGVGSRV